ncbi:hypothetical protein BATDEDRAFT_28412 [Batrachochytrium dendrobatidis JAM81]|uniref:Uncharacterized protein n=1 Tax=Batrachochytrium dendrobatidis (strain JAM81 / FGSC 10211) TaxID=684364 RepID=F4PE16_BATDJ|nr:uncharacterized protein BATDEDRAFT_28412 [Batrachochytrium dendrobatidis JAM81]EGF76578.1 hypothetical protein BATDEDRAFT_28412 [Batrachochytrium dendrobatidis JAM81]|eukprot:XP_006682807.1 hypothetical protein BATDEDRAFT_28412 [Batrachochytrium dendrobatidis JAM81]
MVFTHTNLCDLLNDHNNLDVRPGVEATKKLGNFFQSLNLDIHKDGIFVPRLTLKYLWHTKSKDCKFQLFKGNDELYHKYRDNLVGGSNMPCGEHQVVQVYPDILKDVLDNTFFGMIECDIAVPEHLKECFAGMPPIFKNVEITCNDLSLDTGTSEARLQNAPVPVAMSTFGTVAAGVGALHAPMAAGGCAAIDSVSDQQKAKS